jgi:osmotically-inducible protein OsmY
MHKPNLLLESDVEEELGWDPQLDATRIVVKANDGEVTLSGSVPSFFEVGLASDDVYQVGGVKGLDNQLLVGLLGDAITDGDLAAKAAAALNADRFVPNGSVDVDVLEGYVTLTGRVRNHFQRVAAEHAVSKLHGVLGMSDEVTISGDPIPSDVANRINKAFQRSSIIDDSLITVSNQGETIYLDGTAGSWTARQEAEDTAWAAPGVTNVVNRIEIIPE